jgi:hypothetical protein
MSNHRHNLSTTARTTKIKTIVLMFLLVLSLTILYYPLDRSQFWGGRGGYGMGGGGFGEGGDNGVSCYGGGLGSLDGNPANRATGHPSRGPCALITGHFLFYYHFFYFF